MLRYALLLLSLALGACSLSPQRQAEIDELIEARRGSVELVPDASPVRLDSPLDELVTSSSRQHLLLVEQGSDALALRIHLIRSAVERIELMNYIFHADESGQLLLAELVDAARRGVEVRILVDSLFSLDDVELLAGLELLEPNLEVRLYNPVFNQARLGDLSLASAVFCCFRRLNHRLHHKLLAIDGRHGLLGGRNTADRYFDLDTRMNFLDMEVLVSGHTVAEMQDNFDQFWQHSASRRARHTRDVAATLQRSAPDQILLERDSRAAYALSMIEDPDWLEALIGRAGFEVGTVRYFADLPEKTWSLESEVSTRTLHELIGTARERVLIQTPYFVLSPAFEQALAQLDPSVEVVVSTNSLASTDAWPVYAISRRQRFRMVDGLGVELFEAKPYPADIERFNQRYEQLVIDRALGITSPMRIDPPSATRDMPGPRISVHAKIVVIDDEVAVVTSHNFDPRSERYNTENGVIVEDRRFAAALSEYVETIAAPGNSWVVRVRPDGSVLLGPVNRTMAGLSRRLPTLDLWPWYLTENYRMNASDADELPPALEPVGLAPEVVLLRRHMGTSLVSRLFGFLRFIM
ncbi:phospholipase D family protein [Wenzhouxiangella sp. AB-CW3]|uniref:phospholipase D-like domain-containing protein n=1 Tax=Wenzhouxiangella sp. AB-CW3 TaxID=2771012 RepID=UPI00168ACBE2|nr:phospholipase D family protein [Wenzhouxiangella sp. AB-CW3]QOC23208.1 phospholipase D family protein [Wenzhouxiangella sp. AB-CW3]